MKSSKNLLLGKLAVVDRNMVYLAGIEGDFRKGNQSYERLQAVKYSLFEIVEACIDMASHIIAVEGFQKPDTYGELFVELARNNVIGKELGERLSKMAKVRNVLVHQYHRVDDDELREIIGRDLADVKKFVKSVYDYIG